jgi:riboflavin synthase
MFTGLIRDIGVILESRKTASDAHFTIETRLPQTALTDGASICCNGVCLTVTESAPGRFTTMASHETLSKTNLSTWEKGSRINLEPSLRMGDELGGHLVFGHVDNLGECVGVKDDGESKRFSIRVPGDILPFIASKGSVTINGVSLTVNEIQGSVFGVNIIPHTLEKTCFADVKPGSKVNIEIDMLARYVARLAGFNLQKAV